MTKTSTSENESMGVRRILAAEAGVGEGTFSRYTQIQKEGSPLLAEKVKSGEIKIGTAHRLLGKELIKQLKIADGMYRFIKENIPLEDDDETNRAIYQGLHDLQKKLEEVKAWTLGT